VGSGLIVTADRRQQFGWGMSIIEQLVLRPIPKELLPNKYDIVQKSNVTGADIATTIGWIAAEGSADTLFAQLFTEFSWWSAIVSLLIGWAYGWGWRRSIEYAERRLAGALRVAGPGDAPPAGPGLLGDGGPVPADVRAVVARHAVGSGAPLPAAPRGSCRVAAAPHSAAGPGARIRAPPARRLAQ
jgi:hypothetical protein